MSSCSPDLEAMWVRLNLPCTRSTYLGNIYRPPSGNIPSAIEHLDANLSRLHGEGNPDVILMGDFNIDTSKPSGDRDKLNRLAARYGLTQLIKTHTRVTNTSRSTIDLVFTNNEDYYVQSSVTDLGISDHCLVYTSRRRLKPKNKTTYYIG